MLLFEDFADRAGILKSIQELAAANKSFAEGAEADNERIRRSQLKLIDTIQLYREQLIGLNANQKAGREDIKALQDGILGTSAAIKSQNGILSQNQNAVESNNRVLAQMQTRLSELQKEYDKLDLSQKNDIKRKKEIERELTQTTRALTSLTTATNVSSRAVKAAEGSVDALRQSTTALKNQLNALPDAYEKGTDKINQQNKAAVALNAQYQQSVDLLRKIDSGQRNYGGNVGNYPKAGGGPTAGGGGLAGVAMSGLANYAAGAGVATVAAEAAGYVLEVGQQYEKLNMLTENALNNNKVAAQEASALIKDFADHSPADLETVTESFNRLVDIGIIPTKDQLTQISDVAIAKNKTVMDYVEAIADAQQGEFERLKEFGVNASKQGDKVIFTFKGIRTEVDNNSKAISDYLIGLGKVAGVMGATDKLAQTFAGRWSTVKDGIKGVVSDIFQLALPVLNKLLGLISWGVGILGDFTAGLRAMYAEGRKESRFAAVSNVLAGVALPGRAISAGRAAKTQQAASGTSATDELRRQEEAKQKINDAKRKQDEADDKAAKEADKRLADALAKSKATNDQLLAANEAAQQDGLISERKYINERQRITLAGITERQSILDKAGKRETDDYKKLSADKIEAQTQYKRDALKLSLSESKADAANALAGIGRDNQEGSLSDADYVERKRSILVASLNEQKQMLVAAGQSQSKLAQEIDKELIEVDRDYFKERLKVAQDGWKKELEAAKTGLAEIDKSIAADYANELAKIDAFYGDQRAQVEMKRRAGKISEPEAEKQTYSIGISELQAQLKATQNAYDADQTASDMLTLAKIANLQKYKTEAGRTDKEIESANSDIDKLKKQREQDAADDKKKLDKEVADNAKKLHTEETNHAIAEIDRQKQHRQKMVDMAVQIGQTLVDGLFENQQQETNNRLTALDKQKQSELDLVGNNESAKAAIEKKYTIEKNRLMHQQDVANKEKAMFDIVVNTAVAVSKSLFDPPLAILAGVLGAVQLALVAARPLPQYFAGKNIDGITNDNYAGPALVGERGRELWQHDGVTQLVDRPSILSVGRTDVVYPNWLTEQMLEGNSIVDRVSRQSLANRQLGQNRESYQVRQLAGAMNWDNFPVKRLAKAIGEANKELPFTSHTFDGKGYTFAIVDEVKHQVLKDLNKSFSFRRR